MYGIFPPGEKKYNISVWPVCKDSEQWMICSRDLFFRSKILIN